jgi:hypothetical protein
MDTFYLKRWDTRPVFETILRDPKQPGQAVGDPHDLTGATSATMHIELEYGGTLSKTLTIDPDQVGNTGRVTYI